MRKHDVVIIGAGPYGLSIAAHLGAQGVDFRIFGSPMRTWLKEMPKGMRLKSEGFASSLYDAKAEFMLGEYCRQKGIAYADEGLPVPLEVFSSYGLEFQRKYVPQVEDRQVISVQEKNGGFEIGMADGEVLGARRIVMAVGLTHFAYIPPVLSELPEELVTHSSRHRELEHFKGRRVAVIGAGASALDLAALLHQAGAEVEVIARKAAIRFHDRAPVPRPLLNRMRAPTTGLGPGWSLFFYANAPQVFQKLPEQFRLDAVRRTLGPAPGWFIKEEVVGKVPFNLGFEIASAKVEQGRVALGIVDKAGSRRTIEADHVIAATGYKVDLDRLRFLDAGIRSAICSVEKTPILSSNFESSVPGLYFVGTAAANAFGPLMRFAFGAGFTSRRLSKHLAATTSMGPVWIKTGSGASTEKPEEVVHS